MAGVGGLYSLGLRRDGYADLAVGVEDHAIEKDEICLLTSEGSRNAAGSAVPLDLATLRVRRGAR